MSIWCWREGEGERWGSEGGRGRERKEHEKES